MNDDRQRDQRPGADSKALGDALGEAVAREADGPVEPPPVAEIAYRAAARARARRVRHGVVAVAAAAALTAGLVTWNTLGRDGGDGSVQVTTGSTVPERAASPTVDDNAAQQVGDGSPAPATEPGAVAEPAGPNESEATEPASTDDSGTEEAPAAEPAGTDEPTAATDAPAPDLDGAQAPLAPAEFSTGPTLRWTEVSLDLGEGPTGSVRLESLGDGRVVALIRGGSGDRVAVTGNGTDWTTLAIPDEVFPHRIAVDGDRWLIATSGSNESDPGRVLVSEDGSETWSDLTVEIGSETGLPQHCVERSAIQDALISGDHVVVLLSLHRFLDIEAVLVERGLIPAGTLAHEWRRTDEVLTIRLGDPAAWSVPAEDDGNQDEFLNVTLEELELTPEQLNDCDDYASGRVRVYAGNASSVEQVSEYEGGAASAVATRDGFAIVLAAEAGAQWLTSTDGRDWNRIPTTEMGHGAVARSSDGTVWLSENRGGLRISRGDVNTEPQVVAGFDGLEPVGVLSVGPAGVATTAWALPDALMEFLGATSFAKAGYELRLDNRSGSVSLWDLSEGVAIYEFSAEQLQSESLPEGIAEVTGDDGSLSLVFSDPTTGTELVRFSDSDLVPDTDRLMAAREELFGPLGIPPVWLGWSADGDRWGWQGAAEAFGLDAEEASTAVDLAVGGDFVVARIATFEVAEVLAMTQASESGGPSLTGTQPPESWRIRWFIAPAP